MKLRERIPHTWASYNENYLKSIFNSVSHSVVIVRTTPHWIGQLRWRHVILEFAFFVLFRNRSQETQHIWWAKLASATTEVELIDKSDWQNSAILHSSEDATNDFDGI